MLRDRRRRRRLQIGAGFAVALAAAAVPVASTHSWFHSATVATKGTKAEPAVRLEASLSKRRIVVFADEARAATYGVAVGSKKYPTPPGSYHIRKIVWNPAWIPPDRKWAKGKEPQDPGAPANPMRVVKMYFKEPDYFIHGTNAPGSIGEAASHGCLRMEEGDAADLARYLMEHGGQPREESWFSRVLHFRSETKTVYLERPVPLTISE
jgi:lipoprotein-anchoring transpeptidase ErfK/SrfK